VKVTAEAARRFLLTRHFLLPPRSVTEIRAGNAAVAERVLGRIRAEGPLSALGLGRCGKWPS
jgi:hypothetical protein